MQSAEAEKHIPILGLRCPTTGVQPAAAGKNFSSVDRLPSSSESKVTHNNVDGATHRGAVHGQVDLGVRGHFFTPLFSYPMSGC